MDTNSQECAYIWGGEGGYTLYSCIGPMTSHGLNVSSERLERTSRDVVLNVSSRSRLGLGIITSHLQP